EHHGHRAGRGGQGDTADEAADDAGTDRADDTACYTGHGDGARHPGEGRDLTVVGCLPRRVLLERQGDRLLHRASRVQRWGEPRGVPVDLGVDGEGHIVDVEFERHTGQHRAVVGADLELAVIDDELAGIDGDHRRLTVLIGGVVDLRCDVHTQRLSGGGGRTQRQRGQAGSRRYREFAYL